MYLQPTHLLKVIYILYEECILLRLYLMYCTTHTYTEATFPKIGKKKKNYFKLFESECFV